MTYDDLRSRLNDPETTDGLEAFFTRWSLGEDPVTAALVHLAACDVPIDRVAALTDCDIDEIDALISLCMVRMGRGLREERARRGMEDSAA